MGSSMTCGDSLFSARAGIERICGDGSGARVLCFPHAGGNATWFHVWKSAAIAHGITLDAVQYPGHAGMLKYACARDLPHLADLILDEVGEDHARTHLFGHSMGALVVFELAYRAQRRGIRFAGVHCSGSRPPSMPVVDPRSALPDDAFIDAVGGLDPTEVNALAVPEIAELFLPIVRHDFRIAEDYRSASVLDHQGIHVYAGRSDDEFLPGDVAGWQAHTTASVECHAFDGGHFFLRDAGWEILANMVEPNHLSNLAKGSLYVNG